MFFFIFIAFERQKLLIPIDLEIQIEVLERANFLMIPIAQNIATCDGFSEITSHIEDLISGPLTQSILCLTEVIQTDPKRCCVDVHEDRMSFVVTSLVSRAWQSSSLGIFSSNHPYKFLLSLRPKSIICISFVKTLIVLSFVVICDLLWRNREQVGAISFSLSRNQQCRLFLSNTITQCNPIQKPWNSISINKAYLGYYKRSPHERTRGTH